MKDLVAYLEKRKKTLKKRIEEKPVSYNIKHKTIGRLAEVENILAQIEKIKTTRAENKKADGKKA